MEGGKHNDVPLHHCEEQHDDANVIGDNCVNCGTCADACPLGIISEGDGKYVIDADQCVECGTCAAECPNDAITQE